MHTNARHSLSPAVLRHFLLLFLPAALGLAGIVAILYFRDRAHERTIHGQEGQHVVDLQADIIGREFQSVESDLLFLSGQTLLRDFLHGRDDVRQALSDEYVLFCQNRALYDHVRVLDETGMEVIRVNYGGGRPSVVPTAELQSKGNRYYFAKAFGLTRGQIFVSPFDLNVEHDAIERPLKPVIRFATPVFDRAGRKRGILVLNYLGERLLRNLGEVAGRVPGSVMLLNRGGFFLRGRTPAEEWGFMLGHDRTFAAAFPSAWNFIAGRMAGQAFDSTGLLTFKMVSGPAQSPPRAATEAPSAPRLEGSPESSLLVVSHISPEAVYRRSDQLLRKLLIVYAVVVGVLAVLTWYLAHAHELRRRQERQIEQSEGRLRKLSTQLLTAQEQERQNIARDLHDDLGQLSTLVTIELEQALAEPDESRRRALVERALAGEQQLLERVHALSARLRPSILDDLGLKEAMRSLLADYEGRTGIVPRCTLRFDRDEVPRAVGDNLFRILVEALTNVAKHSGAKEVFVDVEARSDRVTLTVRDAGAGFESEQLNGRGLGILGMRERAELLGGEFTLRSAPQQGTEVTVTVPLANT